MYVHARVTTESPLHREKLSHPRHRQLLDLAPSLVDYIPPTLHFDSTVPLIAYYKKSELGAKSNLMSDYDLPAEKSEEGQETDAE